MLGISLTSSETEQDPVVLPHHVSCLFFVCKKKKLQSKNKFNQRSEKMKKQKKAGKQDKITVSKKKKPRAFSPSSRSIENIPSHVLPAVL